MSLTIDDLVKQAAILQQSGGELISRFEKLESFEEAIRWKADALALVKLFEQYRDILGEFRSVEEQALQEAKAARESLPFHKRLFASQIIEKSHENNIKSADKGNDGMGKSIDHIMDRVDLTPSSKIEQKEMLNELRVQKKELSLEKRAVNESMRVIRTQARQKITRNTGVTAGLAGSLARYDRAITRRQRENALSPHEDNKAALERQLIEIDRRINRVSRLSGKEFGEEHGVVRCAYCGRRVTSGLPCPGCGSDRKIQEEMFSIKIQ